MVNGGKRNDQALPDGTVLHGRYIVRDILGIGGFGITYAGYDTRDQEACAIKELFIGDTVTRGRDGKTVAVNAGKERMFSHGIRRFMEEAQILNKLNGMENVVRITDYFQENNTAYFVMEYVKGMTLRDFVKKNGGAVPLGEACRIICKTGKVLDFIHRRYGIFHRDISPENILIEPDGEPKLIDFGNAKSYMRDVEKNMSIVLKPGFAPPEQYTGKNQGPWTDVYSLAGVFYFITTGIKVPPATQRLAGAGYTPLSGLVPQCRPEISDAVDRGLSLDIRTRLQSTAELADALELYTPADVLREISESAEPYVALWHGGDLQDVWRLPPDAEMVVGRDPQNSNIVIEGENQISKRHCLVTYDSHMCGFQVTDISTNGIFCGQEKLIKEREYRIEPGEKLRLGKTGFVIEVGVN